MSVDEEAIYKEPKDDKSILDDTFLYRRIINQPNPPVKQIVWNYNENCWRPSSIAFSDHPDGSAMSVAIDDTLRQNSLAPESVLNGHEGYSLAAFRAKSAREKGLGVERKPLDNDLAHGEVFGKKTGSVKKHLADAAEWIVPPDLPKP